MVLRGVLRTLIFLDDEDRERFLDILAKALAWGGMRCLAWALVGNHVHLVVQTGHRPIQEVVQRLATRYAQSFNRRHDRQGHLFQGPFFSSRIDEDAYLLEVVRYVHVNRIRAGLVPDLASLEQCRWCGHGALMGTRPVRFESTDLVLRCFGSDEGEARRALAAFMAEGLAGKEAPLLEPRAGRKTVSRGPRFEHIGLLATPEFARRILRTSEVRRERIEALRAAGWTLGGLLRMVVERERASLDDVTTGRRTGAATRIRAIVAHLATWELGVSQTEAARVLGVSQSAIAQCLARGRSEAKRLGWRIPESLPPA